MRRGNPLEVEHRLESGLTKVDIFHNAPLSLIELWGPVSDEQLEAVMAGPDGSMDLVLEKILTKG